MSTNNEDEKLDWMYRNANEHVDKEEYLLGRRLDKNVDPQTSAASDSIPSSIFSLPESTNKVDAIRKIKEDPLEAIREKEREMRKELLKNPIQMKKIQKMLEAQKKKERESGLQKKKKVKNKKKKSKSDSNDNSDSDKELDALLSKKLAKFIKKYGKDKILLSDEGDKNKRDFKKSENKKSKRAASSSDESSDSEDSESDNDRKQETRRNNKYPDRKSYEKKASFNTEKRSKSFPKRSDTSSSSSDESDDKYSKTKQNKKRKQDDKDYKDYRDSSSHKDNHARDTRDSTDDKYKNSKPFGLCVPKGARKVNWESDSSKRYESSRRDSSRDRSSRDKRRDDYNSKEKEVDRRREQSSSSRNRDNPPPRWRQSNHPRERDRDRSRERGTHRSGLTEEERENKLKEMMDNVSWRKDLMEKNTKRHRDQLVKEENQQKNYDENFARNQLSKGIYSESVEKRIKSNIQNIQRSAFAMDKNFAKR